jgi:sensor histidine kinase YesM
MQAAASNPDPHHDTARIPGWRRVRTVLVMCLVFSAVFRVLWLQAPYLVVLGRILIVGYAALMAFELAARWPANLPAWLTRWVLQVLASALVVPLAAFAAYSLTTLSLQWWRDGDYLSGFGSLTFLGLLIAPWISVAALLRQIRGEAARQALAFELERSEFERQALEARLRLLQAQVEPHFLFNTLANVRELVDAGSAQASSVLGSLIGYLRAAVPRLHEPASTLAQELELVRSYLEVMHMRMPDRLQFSLHADDAALALKLPPMSLLTLVENAVRHGIDPAEDGGRIEVRARVCGSRCHVQVTDTGMGLASAGSSLGTGLTTLRERLQLVFDGDAQLHLSANEPHGVCADLDIPAQRSSV